MGCDPYHSHNTQFSLTLGRNMSIQRKIISVLLVLLIPTASAVVLIACPQEMPEMGLSQLPMAMDMVASWSSSSQMRLCCELSPAEVVSIVLRVPVGGDSQPVVPKSTAAVQRVSPRRANNLGVQAASPPVQARLCVFLI